MPRKRLPPFETEITRLGPRGTGLGLAPDGREVRVRAAPPGSRVAVVPMGRKKGVWQARRAALIRPPTEGAVPACPVFGLCGGCVLQELALGAQRRAKARLALDAVEAGLGGALEDLGVRVDPPRGTDEAYGYRNKVELSFGTRRYLSEADLEAGLPVEGRWLGFHAPGRFDRVVDAARCWLISDAANAVLAEVRRHALRADAPAPRDVRTHEGFWRHLLLREGFRTGELLVGLYTTAPSSSAEEQAVAALAEALCALDTGGSRVVGVVWLTGDHVADVAAGEARRTWGRDWLEERLGSVAFRLSVDAFFQTSTAGAEVLYDTVGEALGSGGRLLDLYCGTGAIGLYLADRFDEVLGIEEVAASVDDARANAARNEVSARFVHAKVEHALDELVEGQGVHLVVDPPRAGLHPKVARRLAEARADELVYVACHPGSLGRDGAVLREGGWRLADLWVVDLFPQTGHVEVVARFER